MLVATRRKRAQLGRNEVRQEFVDYRDISAVQPGITYVKYLFKYESGSMLTSFCCTFVIHILLSIIMTSKVNA